jgi:hypothetical protein
MGTAVPEIISGMRDSDPDSGACLFILSGDGSILQKMMSLRV